MPSFAELGCVNAWRTSGSIRLPNIKYALTELDKVWDSLRTSAIGLDQRHDKALEFGFERPIAHWIGVPVSIGDTSNSLSKDLVGAALSLAAPSALLNNGGKS